MKNFLVSFFGKDTSDTQRLRLGDYSQASVGWSTGGGTKRCVARIECDRHSILATEDDQCFRCIVNSQQAVEGGPSANCRVAVLHCGLPVGATSNGRSTLRFILSTTRLEPGTELVLNPSTIRRCDDERLWYERTYVSEVLDHPEVVKDEGVPLSSMWPSDVDYYYGLGERHKSSPQKARLFYPDTLLQLQVCPELSGAGYAGGQKPQLEVVARCDIPYGTCFAYGGEVIDAAAQQPAPGSQDESVAPRRKRPRKETPENQEPLAPDTPFQGAYWEGKGQYELSLSADCSVIGHSITRYINHRYNFAPFGNMQFLCITLVTEKAGGKDGSEKKPRGKSARSGRFAGTRFFDENDRSTKVVPCLIATRDIYAGEKVLACSYGCDFDAVLERNVRSDRRIEPISGEEGSAEYIGDYVGAIQVNSVVWSPPPRPRTSARIHLVVDLEPPYLLLLPLLPSGEGTFNPPTDDNEEGNSLVKDADVDAAVSSTIDLSQCVIMCTNDVGLLVEGLDFRRAAGGCIALTEECVRRLPLGTKGCEGAKPRQMMRGVLWDILIRPKRNE